MFNPGSVTLGELSTAVKDYGILATVLLLGWKARGLMQPGLDLFKKLSGFIDRVDARSERADKHMVTMELGMHTLLNNHLAHLKSEDKSSEKQDG